MAAMYIVTGVSTNESGRKVRFANSPNRIYSMISTGHKDIILIKLPHEMNKLDCVKFIQDLPEFVDAATQQAISEYLEKHDNDTKIDDPVITNAVDAVDAVVTDEVEIA